MNCDQVAEIVPTSKTLVNHKWPHPDGKSFGQTRRTSVVSFGLDFQSTLLLIVSPARAVPKTKSVWLIPEAIPLAINIAGVSCLALGGVAYISAREPFFFLDKDRRRYGDAVYSKYPMPETKPISRKQDHAA